jgi:hypothetical protein
MIKEKQIKSSTFMFLKAILTSEDKSIQIICDENDFFAKHQTIIRDLQIMFDSIPELNIYDEVYFPLYLYPEIAPPDSE